MDFYRKIKRTTDLALAMILLGALLPAMALIALLIRATSNGPVIFRQERLGYKGSIFSIFKFRTMVDKAWMKGTGLFVSENDKRITKIGGILRRLHLDELPQLINVLKGEMSFIGPRPTIPFQYDYYEEWEKARVDVLPGITGWSQINGANSMNWDKRIVLDVWYVENWSLQLDIKIATKTVLHIIERVFGKKDVYSMTGPVWTRGRPYDLQL